ncbi:unnamed protein product [Orchesella dallaii]|uniref:C2H2-type domain-containing protein n=1 Tax=Orchesella dallaii TaxID=48710 RepID=A0ABP1RWU7_9HEXA
MSSSVWKEVREEVLKEFPCSSKPLTVPEVIMIDDDDTNENQDPDFLKIISTASILPDKADVPDEIEINIVEDPNLHETIENSVTFISGDISNDEDDDVLIIDESNELPTPPASAAGSNSFVNAQETQKLPATLIKNQEPTPVKKKEKRKINLNDVDVDIDPSSIRTYAFEDLSPSKYPRYTTSAAKNKKYRRYNCLECHYTTSHFKSGMKQHLELHRPDSGAVNCESCGWLIDQYKISRHNATRHPNIPIRSDVIAPPSLHYKCDECDALLSNRGLLEEHEQIHKEGGGDICKMCGWMVKSLKHHNKLWHYCEDRKKDK